MKRDWAAVTVSLFAVVTVAMSLRPRVRESAEGMYWRSADAHYFPLPDGSRFTDTFQFAAYSEAALEGQKAPDFSLKDLKGKTVKLSGLRGKPVLIDFWATWCPPCRKELPHIQKIHQDLKSKGLVVLGITNEASADVSKFVAKQKMTFTVLLDPKNEASSRYKVEAIPRVLVVDKKGIVVADLLGLHSEQDLRAAVKKAGVAK